MFKLIHNIFNRNKRLICVLEQDPETGGYTSHFEQFPDTCAQGKTKDEAISNLVNTLIAVIELENPTQNPVTTDAMTRVQLPLQVVV